MASETVEYRPARSIEADRILAVLAEVAPEIPVQLTPKAREIISSRTAQCCSSEQSCVAVDHAGRVVGFLLAEPDKMESSQALHLPCAGVTKRFRKQGSALALDEPSRALDHRGVELGGRPGSAPAP